VDPLGEHRHWVELFTMHCDGVWSPGEGTFDASPCAVRPSFT